ncbi:MAG: putative zinc-type alcohol dehydrogenase-like protein, partial [Sediminicola sp.]
MEIKKSYMTEVKAYAAKTSDSEMVPFKLDRRDVTANDIKIDIEYCGVCHSDLHQVRNDWKNSVYPVVPGHEIIGRITEVGADVTKFKVGQMVGVGCMVDSCQECSACKDDMEQFCENGATFTYNGPDKHLGGHTFGGYSEQVVVDKEFVLS